MTKITSQILLLKWSKIIEESKRDYGTILNNQSLLEQKCVGNYFPLENDVLPAVQNLGLSDSDSMGAILQL